MEPAGGMIDDFRLHDVRYTIGFGIADGRFNGLSLQQQCPQSSIGNPKSNRISYIM